MSHAGETIERIPFERIPFRIHPRVFAALGADLVTNDVVAVIELVKNSYDAFATSVTVKFSAENGSKQYLEILDNGAGMDRRMIDEAWCVVATPYRLRHPLSERDKRVRRVAGAKGLGRLSAARLGEKLEMLTKAAGEPCWHVTVDWSNLSGQENMDSCFVVCRRFSGGLPFEATGTRLRILGLNSEWDAAHVEDLRDNLARLLSPFAKIQDFNIRLVAPNLDADHLSTKVKVPHFLRHPPYAIRGHVKLDGRVFARYEFTPVSRGRPRQSSIDLPWSKVRDRSEIKHKLPEPVPGCGAFEFEVRAWDIGPDDTRQIAERYDVAKSEVRAAIRAHKGISVYRDGILILPKSDDARDWLGLDLRRISRVGYRLSTSQIVGYVSISAEDNDEIQDTSDREGLAQNPAVLAFQEIVRAVVSELERERDTDRLKPGDEIQLQALLDGLSTDELTEEVSALAAEGGTAEEASQRVRAFAERIGAVREALKRRFVYYSRLATVGTIAHMLVHEIRNRTTAIGRFLRTAKRRSEALGDDDFNKQMELAEAAVSSLERLADTFAPLASRGFRRGRRDSILEESISRCLALVDGDVRRSKTTVTAPHAGPTKVAIDPGELDTVLMNLLLNALYWIPQSARPARLDIVVRRTQDGKRARVTVSDSGTGVREEDADRIFLPGVTRKPEGIGMGLTVAAEIVSEHGGRISLVQPGKLGGATFAFDLPLKA
jgi:signal transduction histidine kinase